jgi:hypothetical protein
MEVYNMALQLVKNGKVHPPEKKEVDLICECLLCGTRELVRVPVRDDMSLEAMLHCYVEDPMTMGVPFHQCGGREDVIAITRVLGLCTAGALAPVQPKEGG